jgi:hypothetical protein
MLARGSWLFWGLAAAVVAVFLGVAMGTVAVRWLYPGLSSGASRMQEPAAAADPVSPGAGGSGGSGAGGSGGSGAGAPAVIRPEETAARLITRAAGGMHADALALAAPGALSRDTLKERIEAFQPRVRSSALLPDGQALVWVNYKRGTRQAKGYYLVTVGKEGVTALAGPFAPLDGYRSFQMEVFDEFRNKIDPKVYKGKGLVLVAPRQPDPYLPPLLEDLRIAAEESGVYFVLALDTASPDWLRYARAQGYNGLIWRVKGNLETLPAVAPFSVLGAVGILIDREGVAVAPFAVLDPSRYGREWSEAASLLPAIVRAFGLTD